MKICDITNDFFEYEHKYETDFSGINAGAFHSHPDLFEITYVIEGKMDCLIENVIYPVMKGDVMIFMPDEMHGINREYGGEYERINLYIPIKFFRLCGCEELLEGMYERGGVINADDTDYALREQFERIDGYISSGNTDDVILRCVVTELIYMIVKSERSAYDKARKNEYVGDIIAYILNNIDKKLSLDDIAGHMHINKQYMCTMFKKHTGITINDYMVKKRLMRAMELYDVNENLLDSAIAAGFNNYSGFYKAFCRVYNCSPSAAVKQRERDMIKRKKPVIA